MVQKPERGRYLELEGVRVSYKHKDDSIHLTATDPDVPQINITLNKGTATEDSLRDLLVEYGLIKESESNPVAEMEPIPYYAGNPFSALLAESHIPSDTQRTKNILLTGQPGSGKSVAASYAAFLAQGMKMPTFVIGLASDYLKTLNEDTQVLMLTKMESGYLNPFKTNMSTEQILHFINTLTLPRDVVYYQARANQTLTTLIKQQYKTNQPSLTGLLQVISKYEELQYETAALSHLGLSSIGAPFFGYSENVLVIDPEKDYVFDAAEVPLTAPVEALDTTKARQNIAIVQAVFHFVKQHSRPSSQPKMLIVDGRNYQYVAELNQLSRLARSLNLVMLTVGELEENNSQYSDFIAYRSSSAETSELFGKRLDTLSSGQSYWRNEGGEVFFVPRPGLPVSFARIFDTTPR